MSSTPVPHAHPCRPIHTTSSSHTNTGRGRVEYLIDLPIINWKHPCAIRLHSALLCMEAVMKPFRALRMTILVVLPLISLVRMDAVCAQIPPGGCTEPAREH